MSSIYHSLKFLLSSDIDLDLKVFASFLDLSHGSSRMQAHSGEMYLSFQVLQGGVPMHPIAKVSPLGVVVDNTVRWDVWLTLPVKIRDLFITSQLVVKLWGVDSQLLAGTTIRLFSEDAKLKRGLDHLTLWPQHDISLKEHMAEPAPVVHQDAYHAVMKKLEAYHYREVERVPYLDRLALTALEDVRMGLLKDTLSSDSQEEVVEGQNDTALWTVEKGPSQVGPAGTFLLQVHFPYFPYPVVYEVGIVHNTSFISIFHHFSFRRNDTTRS